MIPARNSQSDDSDTTDCEEINIPPSEDETYCSSSAPSLDSSLDRMNLLDSDGSEHDAPISPALQNAPTISITNDLPSSSMMQDIPFSPVLQAVFPSENETNYNSIPSLSSIPLLPSPAVQSPLSLQPTPNTSQHLQKQITTRSVRRERNNRPRLVAKRNKRIPINFKWKKTRFIHGATVEAMPFSHPPAEVPSPRQYFALFFSDEIISDIVTQTNMYSVQQIGRSINVTAKDIEEFVAIHVIMGVVRMPCYLDYWSTQLRYAPVADIMPIKKYQLIRRFLHFVDSNEESSDRFQKVRPVVEKVRLNCLLSAEEENQFSIDEMTLPYKGKKAGNRRQYNAKKPKKWGFKAFVRSGVSGYIYDVLLYGGDDTFRNIQFTDREETLGFGGKVVVALCQSIKNRPCFVYFDNYYTSLELVVYLRNELGIFSLGTIKSNRLRGCQNVLDDDKKMKKRGRGSFSQIVCNENKIAVVKWFDNKPVTLVSSFADSYPVTKIKRYSKDHKAKIEIDCPKVVRHYNTHMGGVDLSDMLIALYRTQMKTRRWYMGIFAQILDISINNGWLLYRRHCAQKNVKKVLSLKDFRCHIYFSLISKEVVERSDVAGPSLKIKKPVKSRPIDEIRYDGMGHLPNLESRGRCRVCKDGQSTVMCIKCNVRLCLTKKRNCFYDFHVKK